MQKTIVSSPDALSTWLKTLDADPLAAESHFAAARFTAGNPACGISVAELNRRYNSEGLRHAYAARIQALQNARQFDEALDWLDVLDGMDPDNAEIPIVKAMILIGAGRHRDAIGAFSLALELTPGNLLYRAYFVRTLLAAGLGDFDPDVKKWLEIFLREPGTVEIENLVPLWRLMLLKNPANPVFARGIAFDDYAAFRDWIDSPPPGQAVGLRDEFFLNGIRLFIIPDLKFEIFLTRLRRRLLEYATREDKPAPDWAGAVAAALAEQCFINEYVFLQTPEEEALFAALTVAMNKAKVPDPLKIAVYACYRPLHTLPAHARKAAGQHWKSLARQQIDEPAAEEKLKKKITAVTPVKDDVSRAVRAQYEENPYPRWTSACPVRLGADPVVSGLPAYQAVQTMLVAGCGTGWHPIMLAMMHPEVLVTGVDLSLASLAYARRMADERGIENLQLFQGDILELGRMDRKFDIIESVGVLHHMKEPEAGWRVLAGLLAQGGLMRIGLYSETARRHIIACQKHIRSLSLPATPEGIREGRRMLAALPDGHDFRSIMANEDFFSASMVRDCLFHVQEHCFTLPRVKSALQNLGLEFLGFSPLDLATRKRYRELFPADTSMTNLDSWHEFEQKYPDSFIGMYQFWCRKTSPS